MIEHNRKGVSVENSIWNKKDKFILASKSRFYVYGKQFRPRLLLNEQALMWHYRTTVNSESS